MHMHHVPSNCGTTATEGMAQEDFAATETESKLGLQQTWWRLIFNQVGSSTVSYMTCMIPRISSHSPSSGATAATRMAGRPPLPFSGVSLLTVRGGWLQSVVIPPWWWARRGAKIDNAVVGPGVLTNGIETLSVLHEKEKMIPVAILTVFVSWRVYVFDFSVLTVVVDCS